MCKNISQGEKYHYQAQQSSWQRISLPHSYRLLLQTFLHPSGHWRQRISLPHPYLTLSLGPWRKPQTLAKQSLNRDLEGAEPLLLVEEVEMVGIFSRFSVGHRRTQSAIDVRETSPPNVEGGSSTPPAIAHGIEIAVKFKPVEHPIEPLNRDQPVKCPLPEPSILNDGRIWKERMSSANPRVRADLPVVKEGSQLESEAGGAKPRRAPLKRNILPSFSAPEHNLIDLLEECNAAGDQTAG